ncbi:MAG: DUF4281 domain-containing protein [Burkholderiales bacterium]|nr:DUF4281 domain-containing protein [Burkholderiales bacterium]
MKVLSTAFNIGTTIAIVGWLALFAYPLWPQTVRTIVLTIAVALLCALYTFFVFFAKHLDEPGARARGGFSSLAGVISLFNSPRVVLAGWIHYLAFDLMVGLFIVTDAARLGIAHWWLLPALFLTLMFGPAGLLLYFATRYFLVPGAMLVVM